MSVKGRTWPAFDDALEKLRRKYPHIEDDIRDSFEDEGPADALPGFSHKLWKKRIPSRDMGKGKRGGFRLIFYCDRERNPPEVHFLTIYAKNQRADIPPAELFRLWKRFMEYLKTLRSQKPT